MLGRLAAVVGVLILLVAAVLWLVHSYMAQPGQPVTIKDVTPVASPITHPPPPAPLAWPTFQGTVVDAKTLQVIPNITVTVGFNYSNNPLIEYLTESTQQFPSGHYSIRTPYAFGNAVNAYFVRMEAAGHYAAVSPPLHGTAIIQDFSLQPAPDLQGRVLAADGTPIANATILLASANFSFYFQDGQSKAGQPTYQTDSQGRFTIPPQSGPFLIAASCDQGWAEDDQDQFAKSGDLRLTPWGRIEGTLMVHGQPAANELVSGQYCQTPPSPDLPQIIFTMGGRTDAQGHFRFDRANASNVTIFHNVPLGSGPNASIAPRQLKTVAVLAHQTLTLTVGNEDRPITGRILIPDEIAGRDDLFLQGMLVSVNSASSRVNPLLMKLNPGRFVDFKDLEIALPPGIYQLTANITGGPGAAGIAQFAVPDGPSDQSVQIPGIPTRLHGRTLEVGDPTPPYATQAPGEQIINLADYRGKYVLLTFWDGRQTDQPPRELSEIYSRYSRDNRLAMIGMCYGDSLDDSLAQIKHRNLPWPSGVEDVMMMTAFGYQSLPSIWLIGPDGKVVARDMKANEVVPAVTKILSHP